MYKDFQAISIDWSKASKEYYNRPFNSIEQIESEGFLYKTPLLQTIKWLNKFVQYSQNNNNFRDIYQQGPNNIFSIVGERGVGKSSFIGTLRDSIENDVISDSNHSESSLYCFSTLDPTLFANKIKLIESILASMKSKVDLACEKNSISTFKDIVIQEKTLFDKKIKEIVKLLQDMRIEKSSYAENKTRVEALDNLKKQSEFRNSVTELIEQFLRAMNVMEDTKYTHICLFIDDLDLVPNGIAYDTLQDIFKFLQYQKKVILFLAYREEQLINSVIDNLLQDNRNIFMSQAEFSNNKQSFITAEEIRDQATNIIEKGLPRAQRIYLSINQDTRIKDVLYPFVDRNINIKDFFGEETIAAFIRNEVIKQTRLSIEPMDKMEITDLVYPKQLRSLIQYLEIIHSFHPYQKSIDDNQELVNVLPLLQKNINLLKYFLLSRFRDNLNKDYLNVIDKWLERDYDSRNGLIVVSLFDLVKKGIASGLSSPILDDRHPGLTKEEENIYYRSSYNVTMGNVFTAFESFKMMYYGNVQALNFLYSLKILYSIENLLLLTKSLNKFCESNLVREFYDSREENTIDFTLSAIVTSSNTNTEEHERMIQPLLNIIQDIDLEDYFKLVRGNIMPDNFYYNNLLDGQYQKKIFNIYDIQRLFSSNIPSSGSISTFGINQPVYQTSRKYYSFKYRNFYEKDIFIIGQNYLVNPFASLTDRSYVLQVFHDICCNINKNHYLFYNIFDLDFFVRKNYTRQSQAGLFKYTLDRVNDIFQNNLRKSDEKIFRKNMSIPLIAKYDDDLSVFDPLVNKDKLSHFDDKEKEQVSNQTDSEEDDTTNIKEFIQFFTNTDFDSVPIYRIKWFLKSYLNIHKEWPDTMTNDEKQRASKLTIPGNKYQKSHTEEIYINKIVEELTTKKGY